MAEDTWCATRVPAYTFTQLCVGAFKNVSLSNNNKKKNMGKVGRLQTQQLGLFFDGLSFNCVQQRDTCNAKTHSHTHTDTQNV